MTSRSKIEDEAPSFAQIDDGEEIANVFSKSRMTGVLESKPIQNKIKKSR